VWISHIDWRIESVDVRYASCDFSGQEIQNQISHIDQPNDIGRDVRYCIFMPPKRRFWKTKQPVTQECHNRQPSMQVEILVEMFASMGEIVQQKGMSGTCLE